MRIIYKKNRTQLLRITVYLRFMCNFFFCRMLNNVDNKGVMNAVSLQ